MGLPAWAWPPPESAACRLAGHAAPSQASTSWEAWAPGNKLPWKFVVGICRTKSLHPLGSSSLGQAAYPATASCLCPSSLAGEACPGGWTSANLVANEQGKPRGGQGFKSQTQSPVAGRKRGRLNSAAQTREDRVIWEQLRPMWRPR